MIRSSPAYSRKKIVLFPITILASYKGICWCNKASWISGVRCSITVSFLRTWHLIKVIFKNVIKQYLWLYKVKINKYFNINDHDIKTTWFLWHTCDAWMTVRAATPKKRKRSIAMNETAPVWWTAEYRTQAPKDAGEAGSLTVPVIKQQWNTHKNALHIARIDDLRRYL
jgi:hypothetical protein